MSFHRSAAFISRGLHSDMQTSRNVFLVLVSNPNVRKSASSLGLSRIGMVWNSGLGFVQDQNTSLQVQRCIQTPAVTWLTLAVLQVIKPIQLLGLSQNCISVYCLKGWRWKKPFSLKSYVHTLEKQFCSFFTPTDDSDFHPDVMELYSAYWCRRGERRRGAVAMKINRMLCTVHIILDKKSFTIVNIQHFLSGLR